MKHGRKVAIIVLGVIVGHIFNFMTIITVDKVFLESPGPQEIERMLKDPSIPKPDSNNPTVTIDLGQALWPWYSKVFYCIILSFTWFVFSRIAFMVEGSAPLFVFYLPAIITSVLFGDLFLPLYLASCYLGVRRGRLARHER